MNEGLKDRKCLLKESVDQKQEFLKERGFQDKKPSMREVMGYFRTALTINSGKGGGGGEMFPGSLH